MPQPLDGKVYGTLFTCKDNQVIPPDEFIAFRPHDNALLPTLKFYHDECARLGCAPAQLVAVQVLIDKVTKWRKQHPERLKIGDVHPGELAWGDPEFLST